MNTLKKPLLVYAGGIDTATAERFDSIRAAIRDAMRDALGGKEYAHGHTAGDVFSAAVAAERWCEAHGLRAKDRAGMMLIDTSSKQRLPAKYNHQRLVTIMQFARRTRGWYLVGVGTDRIWPSEKGGTVYCLTPAQDARVKEWLSAQYAVQPEKGGE